MDISKKKRGRQGDEDKIDDAKRQKVEDQDGEIKTIYSLVHDNVSLLSQTALMDALNKIKNSHKREMAVCYECSAIRYSTDIKYMQISENGCERPLCDGCRLYCKKCARHYAFKLYYTHRPCNGIKSVNSDEENSVKMRNRQGKEDCATKNQNIHNINEDKKTIPPPSPFTEGSDNSSEDSSDDSSESSDKSSGDDEDEDLYCNVCGEVELREDGKVEMFECILINDQCCKCDKRCCNSCIAVCYTCINHSMWIKDDQIFCPECKPDTLEDVGCCEGHRWYRCDKHTPEDYNEFEGDDCPECWHRGSPSPVIHR